MNEKFGSLEVGEIKKYTKNPNIMKNVFSLNPESNYNIIRWKSSGIQREKVYFGSRGHFPYLAKLNMEELKQKLLDTKSFSEIDCFLGFHKINPGEFSVEQPDRLIGKDTIGIIDSTNIAALREYFVDEKFYHLYPSYVERGKTKNLLLEEVVNEGNYFCFPTQLPETSFNGEFVPERFRDQIIPWEYVLIDSRENTMMRLKNFIIPTTDEEGKKICIRGINGLIMIYSSESAEKKGEKINKILSDAYGCDNNYPMIKKGKLSETKV